MNAISRTVVWLLLLPAPTLPEIAVLVVVLLTLVVLARDDESG